MTSNHDLIKEILARVIDRYTAPELVDILEISVEDIVEIYKDWIIENSVILEELGYEL